MSRRGYLDQDVCVEPLVGQWYAWTHLLSPLTAACHIRNRHVAIMESFLQAPARHRAAVADPRLRGGPFLERGEPEQVKVLLDATRADLAPLMQLAEAYTALDRHLAVSALGDSMAAHYAAVPDALRGCVELVYDPAHHPLVHISEMLLRRKYPYCGRTAIHLERPVDERRPFIMSTPRFADAEAVQREIAFDDSALDALFAARTEPVDPQALAERLGIPASETGRFTALFAERRPRPGASDRPRDGLRVRYLGHAGLWVETPKTTILVDPAIAFAGAGCGDRWTFFDLPEHIDYVAITHAHQDHILLETLMAVRQRVGTFIVPRADSSSIVDPSIAMALRSAGITNRISEVAPGDVVEFEDGRIACCPFFGEHGDLKVESKCTYHIASEGRGIFAGADACAPDAEAYALLRDAVGPTQAAFLGMESVGAPYSWLYGPLLTVPPKRQHDMARTLHGSDAQQALAVVRGLGVERVFIYAMGLEPWVNHITTLDRTRAGAQLAEVSRFIAACAELRLEAVFLEGRAEVVL